MANNNPTLNKFLGALDKRMTVRVNDMKKFDDWEATVAEIKEGLPNLMRRKIIGTKMMDGVLNIYV